MHKDLSGTGNEASVHDPARRAALSDALGRVRELVADACKAASREPDEVTLVAVTKTYPASDVLHLAALGVADVGENKDAEAAPKAAHVSDVLGGAGPRWHFIGQLQRNKAKSVVEYASCVHSVDREPLVTALAGAVQQKRPDRPLDVLLQVSIDGDPARGGVAIPDLEALGAAVAARPELNLRGLMAVAPLDWEPERAFAVLAEAASAFRVRYPTATLLSAGMSGDLAEAIAYGATHVRVGSLLLGSRPSAGLA
ncbi:YggS family pyridoxal phosphate-dependent enzyme [Longispora albida]|uniref:YggS family pyridoxal phosphate-dependent enzyme n=1 Tax=Longispora albida TaxID=203523 RepID=UPI000374D0CE|nr:YggS family pyridoxal phosphate-dependent enzyme [Longispora albida]